MKALFLIVLFVVGASAYSKHNLTLVEVAKKYGFNTIVELGERAGLAHKLNESGEWTVFAPTERAFSDMGPFFLDMLRNNSATLEVFLKYHVVQGKFMYKDLQKNDFELTSLAGIKIRVNVYRANQIVTIEGCQLVNADNVASNGILHIINDVMLPPTDNLYETIKRIPRYSIMASLLKKSNLHKELEIEKVSMTEAVLMQYHIVRGVLWRAGMHTQYVPTLAKGERLLIRENIFGFITVENGYLVNRDIGATNGVIHEVSRMLKPKDVDLTVKGQWTIFAPTDEAFDEMGHSFLQELKNDSVALEAFLKYHVVQGIFMYKDLQKNDMELTSVSGPKIRVNVYRVKRAVTVEGCELVSVDNVATNGVLHIIDEVMLAPTDNLYNTILNTPRYSIMAALLKKTNLHKELENGPYTVFVPNNDAFHHFSNSTLQRIENDGALAEVLMKYHIVHGILWMAGMHTTYLQTLAEGDKLLITEGFFGTIKVEGARIISRDIPATNGVIHEISRMLKPKDVDLISYLFGFENVAEQEIAGTYTIFAPNNRAISELSAATVEALNNDTARLEEIIKYHIALGVYKHSDLINDKTLRSLQDDEIRINVYKFQHKFILYTVPDQLSGKLGTGSVPDFWICRFSGGSLNMNLEYKINYEKYLVLDNLLTLFAPNNAAFQNQPSSTIPQIQADPALKDAIIKYHTVRGILWTPGMRTGKLRTLSDDASDLLTVKLKHFHVTVQNAQIINRDISANNGVIHTIDTVLFPPSKSVIG
ncbi:stabilin-2 [Octopus bimaculoides]|uniref:stabilin-2 n=1 Tax=Octopus bimaculoides TaxID=37653 RepID=UPI0022E6A459|nr:stabilin-2 [Octopus bimaculoides]